YTGRGPLGSSAKARSRARSCGSGPFASEAQGICLSQDAPLELSVVERFQPGADLWTGDEAQRDEIVAAHERGRADPLTDPLQFLDPGTDSGCVLGRDGAQDAEAVGKRAVGGAPLLAGDTE